MALVFFQNGMGRIHFLIVVFLKGNLRYNIVCLVCSCLLPGVRLNAQQVRVSASVDSINYLIGDPIAVHISVQHPFNTTVLWQPVTESDSEKIFEKLSESKVDSIVQQDFLSENKTVTFITFDTGLLRIPSFTIF